MPKFRNSFSIETETNNKDIGIVLMQKNQLITFISKTLSPRNQTKPVYKKKNYGSFLCRRVIAVLFGKNLHHQKVLTQLKVFVRAKSIILSGPDSDM